MELIGAVEGLQDLATDAHLLVPGLLLLLLLAEELRGDPGRDDRPEVAPLGRPRLEHASAGRRELSDVYGSACRSSGVDVHRIPVLLAAVRQLHHRCHAPLRRWLRHYRNGTLVRGLRGPRCRGSFHCRGLLRRTLFRDAPALGPRGLEDEGLLHTVGRRSCAPPPVSPSVSGRAALSVSP